MAEVADSFLEILALGEEFSESESESKEFDFYEEEEETLVPSPYWSNSSFHEEEEEDEDEEETLTPIFSAEPYPLHSPGSDHVSLETLDHLDLGLGLDQEDASPSAAAPHSDPGLRIVGFGSDSESDPEPDPVPEPEELCWDDGIEWEEVEERPSSRSVEWEEVEERPSSRGVEWDFFTGIAVVPPMEELEDDDDEEDDDEDYEDDPQEFDFMDPSEYEILFGHFADHDGPIRGSPPAAKAVVESIPSVTITEGDACAVCKEEMKGTARLLPCSHRYHGECILPWLAIRNTCPVCRFELPTDDPEYESGRRGGRYDFEMFPEM